LFSKEEKNVTQVVIDEVVKDIGGDLLTRGVGEKLAFRNKR